MSKNMDPWFRVDSIFNTFIWIKAYLDLIHESYRGNFVVFICKGYAWYNVLRVIQSVSPYQTRTWQLALIMLFLI
jgi:hypothetical protein